jgi:hypothetical protein
MPRVKARNSLLSVQSPFQMVALAAIVLGFVGLGYAVVHIFAATAGSASLYLTPATGTYNTGQSISVQVYVNTGGDKANAVEADFSYPSSKLKFVSVDGTGSAFGIDAASSGANGTVKIARGATTAVSGTGLLVSTVNFSVQAAGTAALSFLNSSAVVRSTDNMNILASTTGANYTLKVAGATPTPTPTPTPTRTPTPAPTPAQHTPTAAPGTPTPKPTPTASSSPTSTPLAAGTTPTITPTPGSGTFAASPTPGSGTATSPVTKPAKHGTNVLGVAAAVGIPVLAIVLGLIAFVMFRQRIPNVVGGDSATPVPPVGQEPVPPADDQGPEPPMPLPDTSQPSPEVEPPAEPVESADQAAATPGPDGQTPQPPVAPSEPVSSSPVEPPEEPAPSAANPDAQVPSEPLSDTQPQNVPPKEAESPNSSQPDDAQGPPQP